MRSNRIFWGILAPVAAIFTSMVLMYIILSTRGADPIALFKLMVSYGFDPRNLVSELNLTVSYYLAGVAAAVGFKMLLFNIGIDGQYRMHGLLLQAISKFAVASLKLSVISCSISLQRQSLPSY
jgi:simple sugar transport system permease protein